VKLTGGQILIDAELRWSKMPPPGIKVAFYLADNVNQKIVEIPEATN
jgi:hypothetical protein